VDPAAGLPLRRISWGLPDAALCWVAGYFAAIMATLPILAAGVEGDEDMTAYTFGLLLPAQSVGQMIALAWVSRTKGLGRLQDDFGFGVRLADGFALLVGAGFQVVLTLALVPLIQLSGRRETQELVRLAEENQSVLLGAAIVLGAGVLAPVIEELLFRGLLLRALLRRMSPEASVFLSALAFALAHLAGDPNALLALPALAALGVVLGVVALRTGSLSRPILIHAGFNLTATMVALSAQ
jgi:membrane protease YdiL (CAAX protease family)